MTLNRDAVQERIGIIGGSGLQSMLALNDEERINVETVFGKPSEQLLLGKLGQVPVAFLQRHGHGHRIPPAQINVRANMAALRLVGCTQGLSMSAVGSLREDVPPGTFVLVDQFIDRTIQRDKTIFGRGLMAHVPFGDPVCARMRAALRRVAADLEMPARPDGTYVVMEGPHFSPRAESNLYRSWGGTVIGMTAMPEAKVAREMELCYSIVAMAIDYDCWFSGEDPVTAGMVGKRMEAVGQHANRLLMRVCGELAEKPALCPCGCNRALDAAIMTAPEHRDPDLLARLASVIPRIRDL
ncbi:5'-methylthioadenosine phosphorylase [Oxalobacteraceae bacterium GrIS 1.11]